MTAPLYWRWVQAIRGWLYPTWYFPQRSEFTLRTLNRLPVIRTPRVDSMAPRRLGPLGNDRVTRQPTREQPALLIGATE